jgi:hypothetical protein
VTYAVTFTAVGKLTTGYSQIRLVAPPGTLLPGAGCNYHSGDNTSGIGSQACLPVTLSNSGATATITIGNGAAAGLPALRRDGARLACELILDEASGLASQPRGSPLDPVGPAHVPSLHPR